MIMPFAPLKQEFFMTLQTIENEHWQVGVLPETGASTAFGRVRHAGQWVDVMRPTAESNYGNSSLCASFIMLPWANRLRDARFSFDSKTYQLQPSSGDGTAIHGTVRRLPWQIASADKMRLVTTFDSSAYEQDKINFPFKFSARAEFWLDGLDFHVNVTLKNEDTQPFPAGFGHHPYFVRDAENKVQVQVFCERRFDLVDLMAAAPSVPIRPEADFRTLKPLGSADYGDLFTERTSETAANIVYPNVAVSIHADPMFGNVLLYAPEGQPFFAIEPQSNANNGFNLLAQGIEGSGVFVLQPGESRNGLVTIQIEGS
jgi:aldose 1-epimerase